MKIAVFIDGGNLYRRLKELKIQHVSQFDFNGFIQFLSNGAASVYTGYYIGQIQKEKKNPKSNELYIKQQKAFAHLNATVPGMRIVRGHIQNNNGIYKEKGVDVQLALDIYRFGIQNIYDKAILISSDSDLLPAIRMVQQKGKKVEYIGFSGKSSFALAKECKLKRFLKANNLKPFEFKEATIKKLAQKDKKEVLDFAYKNEKENLFVIGSFKNYKKPFTANDYYGYFQDNKLTGLAVLFKRFGNFVIHAENKKIIEELVDYGRSKKLKIEVIAAFKKYAEIMMNRLKKTHSIKPKNVSRQTVYVLTKKDFTDFSKGTEEIATQKDIDEIACFNTGKKANKITDADRKKIFPYQEFILRIDGKIVSKANIHGVSKKYFQIGGIGTLKSHQKKGYAKRAVSSLCKHYFRKGIKYGLLFADNDNIFAKKVYNSIGFKPDDEFMIIEY